jgi:hypothetical protein
LLTIQILQNQRGKTKKKFFVLVFLFFLFVWWAEPFSLFLFFLVLGSELRQTHHQKKQTPSWWHDEPGG